MFTRLKAWADRQIDARGVETWVISHRCHQGHLRCGTPGHLFLATNSINQRQRLCPVASTTVCVNCHNLPVCVCPGLAPNAAAADGLVPPCIIPAAPAGISPMQTQLDALRTVLSQQQDEMNHDQATINQLTQQHTADQQLIAALRRRVAALEHQLGLAHVDPPAKRKSSVS